MVKMVKFLLCVFYHNKFFFQRANTPLEPEITTNDFLKVRDNSLSLKSL